MQADFVALDVETANADLASICQVGVVRFAGGEVQGEWETLVNPREEFDPINVSIHGITEHDVRDAPTVPEIAAALFDRIAGAVVVSHGAFDRVAITRALANHGLSLPPCRWLNSMQVVRRAWPDRYARCGYGLSDLCHDLEIRFEHHRAVEDARAAGLCVVKAIAHTGLGIEDWLHRVRRSIVPGSDDPIRRDGAAGGALHGEEVVFTGALSISRREAADLAAAVGCDVAAGVRKSTTILVVGDQDVRKLAGHDKSHKHLKAEQAIAAGQPIRILRESDFRLLVGLETAICPD